MRIPSILLLLLSTLLGGGCANFQAVSAFAKDTGQLTRTVKQEFAQMEDVCVRQAEVVIVATGLADDGP